MPWRFGVDPQYSLFLAKSGWAVFEKETLRVVEVDGVPQIGLKFEPAQCAATLLNTFGETPIRMGATARQANANTNR